MLIANTLSRDIYFFRHSQIFIYFLYLLIAKMRHFERAISMALFT